MIKIFSKAIRSQLLTTDLAYALIENLLQTGCLNYNERQCALRIDKRIKNIKHIIYGGDQLILSKQNLKMYSREVNKLLIFVDTMDVGISTQRGFEFFNSVLLVVSDIRLNVLKSKNKELKKEWMLVEQMLNTLYKYSDTDLSNFMAMKAGKLYGEAIMGLIY